MTSNHRKGVSCNGSIIYIKCWHNLNSNIQTCNRNFDKRLYETSMFSCKKPQTLGLVNNMFIVLITFALAGWRVKEGRRRATWLSTEASLVSVRRGMCFK